MKTDKINLESKTRTEVVKKNSIFEKGVILKIFLVFLFFIFWGIVLLGIFTKSLVAEVNPLKNDFEKLNESIKKQNLTQIEIILESLEGDFEKIEKKLEKLSLAKILPVVRNYIFDAEHGLKAGITAIRTAKLVVNSLIPYADILGLEKEGTPSDSSKTTMDRITFVITTLDKIKPQFEEISQNLREVKNELNYIDQNRYPKNFKGKKIRDWIIASKMAVDQVSGLLTDARPLLEVLPNLLGVDGEKFYFVIFQNDGEIRPTGGFMTAYGILRVDKGKLTPILSQDIYYLDSLLTKTESAPEVLIKYVRLPYQEELKRGIKPQWRLRDMNLSPDFRLSMEKFYSYYQKIPGTRKIDGILAVDTQVLVEILKIIGPIGVPEWGNFSPEIDKRCNCPQVVYRLEELADKPVSTLNVTRKAVIGPLMHSVLLNVFQSPKAKMPLLFQAFLKLIQEKHLLVYLFDEKAQKAVEAFNLGGRIKDYHGDYFHLNDCSFSGAKSNLFIKQSVEHRYEIEADGSIIKTVIINYKNPAPASNCNIEKGDLCLNAPYRDWVRLYLPKGSILMEASGFDFQVISYEELGKTVFEGFFGDKYPLRPQGTAKISFKYKLPFKFDKNEQFGLLIQKQPGVQSYEYSIDFKGKKEEFELRTDKELKFNQKN